MVKNEVSIYDKYHQSHEKKKKKNIHIDKIWEVLSMDMVSVLSSNSHVWYISSLLFRFSLICPSSVLWFEVNKHVYVKIPIFLKIHI